VLVGSTVIGAELDREDLMPELTPEPNSTGGKNQKK
jgi:hypothetical protein